MKLGFGVACGVLDGCGLGEKVGRGDGVLLGVGNGVAPGKGLKPLVSPPFGPPKVGPSVIGGESTWSDAWLLPALPAVPDVEDAAWPLPCCTLIAGTTTLGGAVAGGRGRAARVGKRPGSPGSAAGPSSACGWVNGSEL